MANAQRQPKVVTVEEQDIAMNTAHALEAREAPQRQFGLLSICGHGLMTGCAWPLFGSTIVVSLYNGGPPGVLYEFIAVTLVYVALAGSIAELASAIPSSAGVFHWATVTGGPQWGKPLGFFAGWWNCFAYIFSTVATSAACAIQLVQMYSLYHEEYEPKQWHVLLAYFGCSWAVCGFVMFANRALHKTNDIGLFLILAGFVILLIVCTVMPSSSGNGYATNRSVWREWQNDTGYTSNGFVFVMGMLNGAFALAPLDCVSHLAEELDTPMSMLPKAIFAMVILGFLTTFPYLITLFYAVTDLEAVMGDTTLFPLSSIYRQATGSRAGQMGLSMVLFLPCFWAVVGAYVTAGRTLWTLGRDNATPFSKYIGALHPKYQNPYNATLAVCIVNSLIGLTYLGSTTAFNAFATSVLLLMITGYLAVIGAHLLSGRSRVRPGIFWMKGWIGTVVHTVSCLYTLCFTVIFSFPYSMPVAADTMNYSSLIFGGLTIFISVLWVWKMKHGYTGFTDGAVLGQETAQEGAIMVEVSQASSTQKLQE